MSKYDQQCSLEFSALKKKVDKYFVDVTVSCPYNMSQPATFYQGLFGPLSDRVMELFLAAGYRRNGNALYAMHCVSCKKCVPIRLYPRNFSPKRNQKRVWRKNRDLDVSVRSIQPTRENMQLCERFLKNRYPNEGNTAESYYAGFFLNKITSTYEIRYRLNGRLVGTGVIDIGGNWLNAVYFFFDPRLSNRSLGTYNILTMINFCLKKNIDYLYLGYTIDSLSSMNYKMKFRPHYLLQENSWIEIG